MTNLVIGPPSRKTYELRRPNRKTLIGHGDNRSVKSMQRGRGKTSRFLSPAEVLESGADHPPEPNDKFSKGLRSCKTVADVVALFLKWWKTFIKKVRLGVRRRKLPDEMRDTLEALLTRPGSTSTPNLLNRQICREAFKLVHASLVAKVAAEPGLEVGFVTFICGSGATSHTKTEIELFKSQAAVQRTLRAMSPNFIGITELALFNSQGHPDGGQLLQRHEHAFIIGKDILQASSVIAEKHASHFKPNSTGADTIKVQKVATDEVNLARMAAYLFKPPYKCLNWNPPKAGKPGFMNGSEKGDRNIRYLRLAQMRSMMSIEEVTFGGGIGKTIRSDMIKFLRALAIKEAASTGRTLHPDAISSFWVGITQEIKPDRWNLPIVQTRK